MGACNKVFAIVELIALVADQLSQHDQAFCCSVSQHWFDAFTPHLWHSIIIQHCDRIPKFQSLGLAGLLRNGHHIRVLRTWCIHVLEPFIDSGEAFDSQGLNLSSLSLTITDFFERSGLRNAHFSNLRRLEIGRNSDTDIQPHVAGCSSPAFL